MRALAIARSDLATATFVALLAGCGGSQPPIGVPGAMPQNGAASALTRGIYASQNNSTVYRDAGYTYIGEWLESTVNAYRTGNRRNDGPICQTGSVEHAEGMATDDSDALYVATGFTGGRGGVGTFGPNCGSAGPTFDEGYGGGSAQDPVLDGRILYLTSINDTPDPASVFVYDLNGSSQPIARLSDDPAVSLGIGLAVDSHHDLFWSTNKRRFVGGQVIEFKNGQMPGRLLKTTRIGQDYPGGVLVDKHDNLLFIDQSAPEIRIYAPPYNAAPFSTISLKGFGEYCALGVRETRIYCMDEANASVDAYTYPAGEYLYSYNNDIDGTKGPVGIAIQPPLSGSPIARPLDTRPHVSDGKSWVAADAKRIKELLYVSDWHTDNVYVDNYESGQLLGKLSGFDLPYGQCVDAKGDVWIANYKGSAVIEYAHGAIRPLRTLSTGGYAMGCSVAPNGDLAVASVGRGGGGGEIQVWKAASGTPADYSNRHCYHLWQPGYDDKGNLYVITETKTLSRAVCELAAGGKSLKTISINAALYFPGSIMWDGKYITISDQEYRGGANTGIYQAKATGSGDLKVVSSTELGADCPQREYVDVVQPFIVGAKNTPVNDEQGTAVVGGNLWCKQVDYWAYPAGSTPTTPLSDSPKEPYGQAVSIKD